jgi:hypothetical protein
MEFSKMPMSIKKLAARPLIFDKMEDSLLSDMKAGTLACDCDTEEHGCFDCVRSAAEDFLSGSDALDLENMEFDEMDSFSDDFEHELDKAVASVLRKYHS